jgi:spore coat polysaccharide biosynthesis predicted glycosyltransferase SpsG
MKIAVFCTGGTNLGFGHFFRSKTFVKSAPRDIDIRIFPVVDNEDKHIFKELGAVCSLCDSELMARTEILQYIPDMVVFDTVHCSDETFFQLKEQIQYTVSISPVFNQIPNLDYLFTRNANTLPVTDVTIFKGFKYAILNENCKFIPDEVYYHNLSKEFLTVGIAMGGGDAPNKTLNILKSISKINNSCMFWVLLGEGYKHSYQDLVNSIAKDSNHEIILAKTNRSTWNILSNCSVAILAGGLTTMEAVYAGLPTLNIFEKEDHLHATGIEVFEKNMAENFGLLNEESINNLIKKLEHLSTRKSLLLEMRENSKGKVDKLGPVRIYEELKKIYDERLLSE